MVVRRAGVPRLGHALLPGYGAALPPRGCKPGVGGEPPAVVELPEQPFAPKGGCELRPHAPKSLQHRRRSPGGFRGLVFSWFRGRFERKGDALWFIQDGWQ
jgi:hypothetical protein